MVAATIDPTNDCIVVNRKDCPGNVPATCARVYFRCHRVRWAFETRTWARTVAVERSFAPEGDHGVDVRGQAGWKSPGESGHDGHERTTLCAREQPW